VAKPRSSRASSIEAFVVCEGFRPVPVPGTVSGTAVEGEAESTRDTKWTEFGSLSEPAPPPPQRQIRTLRSDGVVELTFPPDEEDSARYIAPFLACGDLSAWDSDATYKLPPGHVSLDPVQPPTAPPYKAAIERRRLEGGMYGKTKNKATVIGDG
jgi:tRNA (cytidine32/guanosine34-2'-O)-methyltransferase